MLDYETETSQKGFRFVAGIDEAGRGPLAGPVVASAVSLHKYKFQAAIRDSKKLSAKQREEAFKEIHEKAHVGVGIVSETVIDQINILEATFLAMHKAVEDLVLKLQKETQSENNIAEDVCLLIDGHQFKTTSPYQYKTIVRGDQTVLSIACASIIAKVTRDRILDEYDKMFPEYGFKNHKGYGTKKHREAIKRLGPTKIHRRSFKFK